MKISQTIELPKNTYSLDGTRNQVTWFAADLIKHSNHSCTITISNRPESKQVSQIITDLVNLCKNESNIIAKFLHVYTVCMIIKNTHSKMFISLNENSQQLLIRLI